MAVSLAEVETAMNLGEQFMVDALKRRPSNVQNMGDMEQATRMVIVDTRSCTNAVALFIDWGGSFMEADGLPRPTYDDYLILKTTEG